MPRAGGGRWVPPLPVVPLTVGQWVRIPGTRGFEVLQRSGEPQRVTWFPFGNLPNGVPLPLPAAIYDESDAPVRGFWDLSHVSGLCVIRHRLTADPGRVDRGQIAQQFGEGVTRPLGG